MLVRLPALVLLLQTVPMPTPAPTILPPEADAAIDVSITFDGSKKTKHDGIWYQVEFTGRGRDFRIDTANVHIDRSGMDGRIERRDVGVAHDLSKTTHAADVVSERVTFRVSPDILRPGLQRLSLRLGTGAATRDGMPQPLRIRNVLYDRGSVVVHRSDALRDVEAARRFVGSDVRTYGRTKVLCGAGGRTVETEASIPLRVTGVSRAAGEHVVLRAGSETFAAPSATYDAVEPLTVTFAAPQTGRFAGCPMPAIRVAGIWDLERIIGRDKPARAYDRLQTGMRRADVALLLGYPANYETKAKLDTAGLWSYVRLSNDIIFTRIRFAGDQVSEIDGRTDIYRAAAPALRLRAALALIP